MAKKETVLKETVPKESPKERVTPKKAVKKEAAPQEAPKERVTPKKVVKNEAAPKEAPKERVTPKKVVKNEAAPQEAPKERVTPKKAVKNEAAPQEAPKERVTPKKVVKKEAAPQEAAKPVVKTSLLAHGVGRRKSAVARVWLKRGRGSLVVNDKEYVRYFDTELARRAAVLPFAVYPQATKYDVYANVSGGGLSAQADAIKLGIARALLEVNPEIRPLLRQHGLLTVDSRVKERKKYGQKAARRKFQFVKR